MVEPFQPESVLTFCNYLGVSRYEMHKTISDALKTALEYEIEKVDVTRNKNALFDLLSNSWHFISVPELRSVFLTVMKKLGDETPVQVLVLLAKRNDSDGELKYGDLLNSLSLDMKRLVWEADFDSTVRGDGIPVEGSSANNRSADVGTLKGNNIFIDVIRTPVEQYLNDENMKNAANLAYMASFRDKKYDTQLRRAVKNAKEKGVVSSAGVTGKLSALAKTEKVSTSAMKDNDDEKKNVTGMAVASLKEVTGSRPKLLAAILNILIAEHGKRIDKGNMDAPTKVVDGASSLHCTLLSDVLLSFGKLPRHYEHVRLLAQTLDECVQKGIISDKSVSQIQICLRAIFQPDQDGKDQVSDIAIKKEKQAVVLNKSKKKESSKHSTTKIQNEAERQFELKLLRKIIKGAVTEMKANDPQGLFLNPVTDEIAPGYSRVIKNPMCIRTIEDKAVNLRYETLGQYEIDVGVMFENCCKYNIGVEGKWFRTEAKRQLKKWKDEILKQKKNIYKQEMNKRKKQLANAAGNSTTAVDVASIEEDKKKELLERQKKLSMIGNSRNSGNKRKIDVITKVIPDNASKVQEIAPLPESKAKKRKKDTTFPSTPALASMLLSDPFVIRLLFDKILRALKKDVITRDKNIPAEHSTIPSVLQIINIANLSRKICAMKGKIFVVPDAGLVQSDPSDNRVDAKISESYTVLRKQIPRLASLLLSTEIDRRIAAGGDLQILPRLPDSKPEEWQLLPTSSQRTILDLVEGSLVLLLQPGASNEAALLCQCPRFFIAIKELSRGEMADERCFFVSLTQALLKHKAKLSHSVRNMIVEAWLTWFGSRRPSITKPVHLCFLELLNEWASMGNQVLPIDLMITWSEDAVKASEGNGNTSTFVNYWNENNTEFAEIKAQYERMLRAMPEDRTIRWKDAVGITTPVKEDTVEN